jgi:altronate hydrolase
VKDGIARVKALLPEANKGERETRAGEPPHPGPPVRRLRRLFRHQRQPALGAAPTCWCATAAPPILSETPEIYGAEHLLTRRAVSREVGEKLLARIRWWEDYTAQPRRDEQQSLARQQGGRPHHHPRESRSARRRRAARRTWSTSTSTPRRSPAKGFVFMDTPGYDPVSVTGQVAGGANIVCFTTGRGSAYGCKPAPSLKLATNTALYQHRKRTWTSTAARSSTARETVEQVGQRIFEADPRDRLRERSPSPSCSVRAVRRGRVRALGCLGATMWPRYSCCDSSGAR